MGLSYSVSICFANKAKYSGSSKNKGGLVKGTVFSPYGGGVGFSRTLRGVIWGFAYIEISLCLLP